MAHCTLKKTLNKTEYIPFNIVDTSSNVEIFQNGVIKFSNNGIYLINWTITCNSNCENNDLISVELKELSKNETLGWSNGCGGEGKLKLKCICGTSIIEVENSDSLSSFALVNASDKEIIINPQDKVGTTITIVKIN